MLSGTVWRSFRRGASMLRCRHRVQARTLTAGRTPQEGSRLCLDVVSIQNKYWKPETLRQRVREVRCPIYYSASLPGVYEHGMRDLTTILKWQQQSSCDRCASILRYGTPYFLWVNHPVIVEVRCSPTRLNVARVAVLPSINVATAILARLARAHYAHTLYVVYAYSTDDTLSSPFLNLRMPPRHRGA